MYSLLLFHLLKIHIHPFLFSTNPLSICSVFHIHGYVFFHHSLSYPFFFIIFFIKSKPNSKNTTSEFGFSLSANPHLHFPQRRASLFRRRRQLPRSQPLPRPHPQPPGEAGRMGLPPAHVHFPQRRPIRPKLLPAQPSGHVSLLHLPPHTPFPHPNPPPNSPHLPLLPPCNLMIP